jgi:signal peptidase II
MESEPQGPPPTAPAAEPSAAVVPAGPAKIAPAPARARRRYVFLAVVTALSLAADLGTKAWAKAALSGFEPRAGAPRRIEVVKNHLDFVYALNPGGAWSFLRGLPELLRRPFFLFISAAAIVFIVSVYRRVRPEQTAMRWGLPLALGGAIGNLVDRIRYGSVIDFIDFFIQSGGHDRHWPTFNVADVAIVVGVALMALDTLLTRHVPEHASAAPGASAPGGAGLPGARAEALAAPVGELGLGVPAPSTPPAGDP